MCVKDSETTLIPKWLVAWHRAPLMANLYPSMFGIICYGLLIYLPDNVVTQYSRLEPLVDFVSSITPSVDVFSANVPHLESAKLVHSLSWLMLPLWLPAYPWVRLRSNYESEETIMFRLRHFAKGSLFRKGIILALPALTIIAMWLCWTAYAFDGGPAEILAFSLKNKFFIAILIFVHTQGFLFGLFGFITSIIRYRLLLRSVF